MQSQDFFFSTFLGNILRPANFVPVSCHTFLSAPDFQQNTVSLDIPNETQVVLLKGLIESLTVAITFSIGENTIAVKQNGFDLRIQGSGTIKETMEMRNKSVARRRFSRMGLSHLEVVNTRDGMPAKAFWLENAALEATKRAPVTIVRYMVPEPR